MPLACKSNPGTLESLKVEVSSVPPEMVDYVWSSQLPMIEKALSHGQGDASTSDNVLAEIRSGKNQLWVVHRDMDVIAVIVLSVRSTAVATKVFVELIAGRDITDWSDQVQELLLDFRDLVGADCVEASCRAGLAKYLGSRGWSKKATIMELK